MNRLNKTKYVVFDIADSFYFQRIRLFWVIFVIAICLPNEVNKSIDIFNEAFARMQQLTKISCSGPCYLV